MPQLDLSTAFFGLIGWVLVNQVFMRWTNLWQRAALFWTMQAINATIGLSVLALGIPGFAPFTTPTMALGGLFAFRVVVNVSQYQQYIRSVKMSAMAEQWERERAELERLRKDG